MIGRILAGRYKIVGSIGEGGMSRVWRATDMNTGKAVAVKVLRDEYRDDETFVRRFEREAQAASRMTHPNIANLLDVGLEEDGTRYLVIEYVSGTTLKQFIRESGAIRPETAAQIIIRVLAAVQHAHQNGVIHRDIKPQNILIDREGSVKVADFGIARVANAQTMNQENETVMGSVYYFSPEQAKGAAVDEKSDLYSVGIVFYEMLTGEVPFSGDTPVAIAMKHLQEPPIPPSEINPAVSPAMDFVVLTAMEKRPRNRYASAADMLRDVRLALDHPDTILAARAEAERRERESRAAQRRKQRVQKRVLWMRRLLVGVFTLVLLALTAIAGYALMERVLLSRRNSVEVPNVIGILRDDAITQLIALGLDPVVSYASYDLVPENIVADQNIAPGTFVAPGEKVTITVCRSTYDVRVPTVTNISYNDASKIITDLGLIVGDITYSADRAEYNMVIYQSLAPGSAANVGDTIDLVLSGGMISMPRFVDLTLDQAQQLIYNFDLKMGSLIEVQISDPSKVGKIVGQSPAPYREVMRNTQVILQLGIPADTLYTGEIVLDLSMVPVGTTISVAVGMENEEQTTRYIRTIDEKEEEITISVYSEKGGDGFYTVYYNEAEHSTGIVNFSR